MHFSTLTSKRLTSLIVTAVCAVVLIPVAALTATASTAAPAQVTHTSASAKVTPAISINSVALVANGVAIRVVFTATCNSGDDRSIASTTTEAVGEHIAQGTTGNYDSGACTGAPQQVTEIATANISGAPFRSGIVLVQASLSDCPGANCTGASTDKILRIGR